MLFAGCHPTHDPLPGSQGAIDDPIAEGELLYTAVCASCHLENGAGLPGINPPLDGSRLVNGPAPPLAAIMIYGLRGPVEVKGIAYNGIMPMWKDVLNDQQIAAILTYIRQAWSNDATEIGPREVSQMRAARPLQNSFLTPEELQTLSQPFL